jgi:hypothetical protein
MYLYGRSGDTRVKMQARIAERAFQALVTYLEDRVK